MQYVGCLLILAAGMGLGWYASRRLSRRVTALEQLERVLDTLLRQMSYTALPMRTLWLGLAQNGSFSTCPLVQETATRLEEGSPFSAAFAAAVDALAARDWLQPPEQAVLLAFSRECGQYDLARQTAQLKGCRGELSHLLQEARGLTDSRGRLYRVLGAAGGGALALLLL